MAEKKITAAAKSGATSKKPVAAKKTATAAAKPAAKTVAKKAAAKPVASPSSAKKTVAAAKKPAVKKAVAAKSTKSTSSKPKLRSVEFRCYSPDSGIVELAGDFNGWVPSNNPMKKSADGNWSVSIKLLPGRYTYKFVYDGVAWELDRQAPAMADLEGHLNSVIDVV